MSMITAEMVLAIILISFFCFTFPYIGFGYEIPRGTPEDVGLSSKKLAHLETVINGYIEKEELAGTVVLIARRSKIIYFKAFGHIDIEAKRKMPLDAICRIASMTKVVTSVAVLILYEDGRLLLNDPVSKYLPEFKNMKVLAPAHTGQEDEKLQALPTVPAEREITIRDLLCHTSGLTYGNSEALIDKLYREAGFSTWNGTLAQFGQQITKFPLACHPGKKWGYSYSLDVLGNLIEVVSGQALDKFMSERIFKPLGMKDTGFYVPQEKLKRLANFYKFEKGSLHLEESAIQSIYRKQPSACSGGGSWWTGDVDPRAGYGGLVTTANDYARFLQMILNYGALGEKRLLSRKSLELMTTDHIKGIPRGNELEPGETYGLGVGVITDPGKFGELSSPGEIFWAGAPFNTFFLLDFKEEMFCLLLTQTAPFKHLNLMKQFRVLSLATIDD